MSVDRSSRTHGPTCGGETVPVAAHREAYPECVAQLVHAHVPDVPDIEEWPQDAVRDRGGGEGRAREDEGAAQVCGCRGQGPAATRLLELCAG